MGDTHGGFRTVNVLTACARRAIDVDTQIRRVRRPLPGTQ
ncbi:hypothetical protein LTSEHVI_4041, partial [Salmonella enterica subsp. enterica serovar Hvittingfoss str. A4-620]